MPYMSNGKRDYKKENTLYKSRPKQVKAREERNKARAMAINMGIASKGDNKQVDHIIPLSKNGKTIPSNLRNVSASQNDSFKRNSKSQLVSQESRKERSNAARTRKGR